MALGTVLVKDDLAQGGVAGLLGDGQQALEYHLAVCAWQPTTTVDHLASPFGQTLVGVTNQALGLVDGKITGDNGVILQGLNQGAGPFWAAEQDLQRLTLQGR